MKAGLTLTLGFRLLVFEKLGPGWKEALRG